MYFSTPCEGLGLESNPRVLPVLFSHRTRLKAVDTMVITQNRYYIKPYLVTSNRERLIVQNIVRNGSLWSDVVFEKEVVFLKFRFWGLEIKHLKAHNFVWQGCFIFFSYLATPTTNWALNFYRFVILCIMLLYTKWEDWSLTITKSVYWL